MDISKQKDQEEFSDCNLRLLIEKNNKRMCDEVWVQLLLLLLLSLLLLLVLLCCCCCFCFRIPIHHVVLAGSSDYFKTAFGTNWNNNNTDNNTEVTFTVQQDEIIAFKAILKFFYTSILPEDLMICDLLIMFRLSNILICKHLMQTIESRLESASSDDIENNDLISFSILTSALLLARF